MGKKSKKDARPKAKPGKKKGGAKEKAASARYWLFYPKKLVQRPVIYELGHTFDVVTNVRQATVHDDCGLISLEVEGAHDELEKAVAWLEKQGIKVEPVEVNVIAG